VVEETAVLVICEEQRRLFPHGSVGSQGV
jgi:hypothetical protein